MSESELVKQLAEKQNKQFKKVFTSIVVILAIVFLVFTLLVALGGHSIRVNPVDANGTKTIDVTSGLGFALNESVYRLGGKVVVKVSADKFKAENINLTSNSPSLVNVVLSPLPATISARSLTKLSTDIEWFLNNSRVAVGPLLNKELDPGEYTLEARATGYEAVSNNFQIESGESLDLGVTFEKLLGQIQIRSKPQGATVYINNEKAGKTPLFMEGLVGPLDLTIKLKDFESVTETLQFSVGNSSIKRTYNLQKKPAFLKVLASPEDGKLTIGGDQKKLGNVQIASQKKVLVTYEKPGYEAFSSVVELAPGESKNLSISLKQDYGVVEIITTPQAEVKIDGNVAGFGTISNRLNTKAHKIEISKPGFRTIQKIITPKSNQTITFKLDLTDEFEARRKEGAKTIAESHGIELIKFRPTDFLMGSPGNERGRQGNEFSYPVTFSKKILVSKHEITEEQYAKFSSSATASKLPISNVSWVDAVKYCNWLSAKEGLAPFYLIDSGLVSVSKPLTNGYRLPSESEWEWLAKSSKRAKSTKYVWGNIDKAPKDSGNYGESFNDGFSGKSPVGSFKADISGLFDLAGNVSEWVHDFSSPVAPLRSDESLVDYLGPSNGKYHLIKGGSYKSSDLAMLRTAYKTIGIEPREDVGFRIVRYE